MKSYKFLYGLLLIGGVLITGMARPGFGQQIYSTNLSAINEIPAGLSLGSGSIHAVLRGDSLKIYGSFSDLTGDYTASYIQLAPAGDTGAVAFTLNPGVDSNKKGGTLDSLKNRFKLTTDQLSALADGKFYVNILSSDDTTGELRGQLFSEGNAAPTASSIMQPADGSTLAIEGSGVDSVLFKWNGASDPDNDPVFYIWQVSPWSDFHSIPIEQNVGALTHFSLDQASLDELLQAAGVPYEGSLQMYFRLMTTDGSNVTSGAGGSVTITRDTVYYTIRQAHAAPVGSQVTFTGIVTRAYGAYTYVQDSTGGIAIHQVSGSFNEAIANGSVKAGDEIQINGNVSDSDALREIDNSDIRQFTVLSRNHILPDPLPVTLKEIAENGENYESRLIRLNGLTISGSGSFSAATSYQVVDSSDQSHDVALYVPEAANETVAGASIPPDSTVFVGVVGQSSAANPDAGYRLRAVLPTDVYKPAWVQTIHAAPDPKLDTVDVYINGLLIRRNVAFRQATPFTEMPGDRELTIGLAPAHSTGISDTVKSFREVLNPSESYVAVITGVLQPDDFAANPDDIPTGVKMLVKGMAQQEAKEAGKVDFFAVDGVPDAPAIDLSTKETGSLVTDVKYNDMTDYLSLPAQTYNVDLAAAGTSESLVAYKVDLTDVGDTAAVLVASGFLYPDKNQSGPALKLLVVFPDGTVVEPDLGTPIEQEPVAQVPDRFSVMNNYPNPFNPTTNLRFNLPQNANVTLTIYNILGQKVFEENLGRMSAGFRKQVSFDASHLSSGVYLYRFSAHAASKVYSGMGKMTLIK